MLQISDSSFSGVPYMILGLYDNVTSAVDFFSIYNLLFQRQFVVDPSISICHLHFSFPCLVYILIVGIVKTINVFLPKFQRDEFREDIDSITSLYQ